MDGKPFFLEFLKKDKLTSDCYTFYFKRTPESPEFTPGQYFEMKLNIKNPDERGDAHVFTLSSSPTDREFYTITTRIIQSTFKLRLAEIQPGERVQFDGPWNDLNFDENDTSPHVFLAGGIGITPYHSIVKYAMEKNLATQMILLVSWKNRSEMIFDEFFREVNNHMENFTYVPTLTDEQLGPSEWDGEIGRITGEMLRKYITEINVSKYYFSGPPSMVTALKETVKDMGVPNEKIISEEFEGY